MDQHCCHQWLILSTWTCTVHILYLIKTTHRMGKEGGVRQARVCRWTHLFANARVSCAFRATAKHVKKQQLWNLIFKIWFNVCFRHGSINSKGYQTGTWRCFPIQLLTSANPKTFLPLRDKLLFKVHYKRFTWIISLTTTASKMHKTKTFFTCCMSYPSVMCEKCTNTRTHSHIPAHLKTKL